MNENEKIIADLKQVQDAPEERNPVAEWVEDLTEIEILKFKNLQLQHRLLEQEQEKMNVEKDLLYQGIHDRLQVDESYGIYMDPKMTSVLIKKK